jgi:hypothetical protein
MPKRGQKSQPVFQGRWNITWMSTWGEDYLNEEVQAFIEFLPEGAGEFQFGLVRGDLDYREGVRDGKPAVEWTWDGQDEMDPVQGRGWAVLEGDELLGMFFIHLGDESDFVASRVTRPRSRSRRK